MTFKLLDLDTDKTTTRTLLHEAIPLTGTIVSGTYGAPSVETNIKNYSHGMFQSVYDYPYLSSSANHILDLSVGFASTSPLSASTAVQNAKKINVFNNIAGTLEGYTSASALRLPESDLTVDLTGTMNSCFIIPISRLLTKDQIKLGSFSMAIGTGSWAAPFAGAGGNNWSSSGSLVYYVAASGSAGIKAGTRQAKVGNCEVIYRRYGPAGNYTYSGQTEDSEQGVGLVYHQAGVVILTSSIFDGLTEFINPTDGRFKDLPLMGVTGALTGTSISGSCYAFRHRWYNMYFQNTTEINSTIYFCRAGAPEFNSSTNPTYVSGSKMRVKSNANDPQISYITTVGLYSSDNQLLAVGKLSEPLKKDPTNEVTIRVRLDY
tara:strand:- start:110 stop:1237 length:1128 start_codon:yes stop_codon:yes gene_type:complete